MCWRIYIYHIYPRHMCTTTHECAWSFTSLCGFIVEFARQRNKTRRCIEWKLISESTARPLGWDLSSRTRHCRWRHQGETHRRASGRSKNSPAAVSEPQGRQRSSTGSQGRPANHSRGVSKTLFLFSTLISSTFSWITECCDCPGFTFLCQFLRWTSFIIHIMAIIVESQDMGTFSFKAEKIPPWTVKMFRKTMCSQDHTSAWREAQSTHSKWERNMQKGRKRERNSHTRLYCVILNCTWRPDFGQILPFLTHPCSTSSVHVPASGTRIVQKKKKTITKKTQNSCFCYYFLFFFFLFSIRFFFLPPRFRQNDVQPSSFNPDGWLVY